MKLVKVTKLLSKKLDQSQKTKSFILAEVVEKARGSVELKEEEKA